MSYMSRIQNNHKEYKQEWDVFQKNIARHKIENSNVKSKLVGLPVVGGLFKKALQINIENKSIDKIIEEFEGILDTHIEQGQQTKTYLIQQKQNVLRDIENKDATIFYLEELKKQVEALMVKVSKESHGEIKANLLNNNVLSVIVDSLIRTENQKVTLMNSFNTMEAIQLGIEPIENELSSTKITTLPQIRQTLILNASIQQQQRSHDIIHSAKQLNLSISKSNNNHLKNIIELSKGIQSQRLQNANRMLQINRETNQLIAKQEEYKNKSVENNLQVLAKIRHQAEGTNESFKIKIEMIKNNEDINHD